MQKLIIVGILLILLLFVVPTVLILIRAYYQREYEAQNETPSKKRSPFWEILICHLLALFSLQDGFPLQPDIPELLEDIRKEKHAAEISKLKHRKPPAKLPDAPDWKCTCGRVNPAYTSTCVCGQNKRKNLTETN